MGVFSLPTSLTDEMERLMNTFWWGNKGGAGRGINWMIWERLCVDKKLGGIGFRSMQLLNIALLGKMGWRLLHEPDALVCKVLKAKYFPKSDFLNAKIGHSPSFSWMSIMSAQDLVRRGVRWWVGDGSQIRVFADPWLRRDDSFHIVSPCPPGFAGLKVAELYFPISRQWDLAFMETILGEDDIREIRSISILPHGDLPNGEIAANICMLLWQLWKERNVVVWKNSSPTPSLTVVRAVDNRKEWMEVRKRPLQFSALNAAAAAACVGWHNVPYGSIVCYMDAAFFNDIHIWGIGMAVRDHVGDFIIGLSIKLPGSCRVEEGELIGIKEALSWIKNLSFDCGFVEVDCRRACDLVNFGDNNILEMGIIADCCRRILVELSGVKLRHIKRDRNMLAHCLDKAARDINSYHVWNEPPLSVFLGGSASPHDLHDLISVLRFLFSYILKLKLPMYCRQFDI
ncbi:uncharacterized protein LOC130993880 [Salvia miltiorrhiza]|uniref:uncharacterized protein LOC130993880 n=1 Tax=Salvia miltiorrhiza TaxID=226208 RepID=UPI0025AD7CFC|nr:uncharacterized protein LOC130993880 [Salvia miltiorrhiza]